MEGAKKNEWRDIALLGALVPGLIPPLAPTEAGYSQLFGLWCCRTELMAQAEWIAYVGTSYARSLEDIPATLFMAAFDDESSAFEAMVRVNNAREFVRARRELDAQSASGVRSSSLF